MRFSQKHVGHSPDDSSSHLDLAYGSVGQNQYVPAIAQFHTAASLGSESPGPLHALGQAQLHAARYADAQQTYRRLLVQFPNDTRAQAALDFATHQLH